MAATGELPVRGRRGFSPFQQNSGIAVKITRAAASISGTAAPKLTHFLPVTAPPLTEINAAAVLHMHAYMPNLEDVIMALVVGTSGDDTLIGTPEDDVLRGFDGNDILEGLDGWDEYHGGAGNDLITVAIEPVTAKGIEIYDGGNGYDTVACEVLSLKYFGDLTRAVFTGIEQLDFTGFVGLNIGQVASFQSISAAVAYFTDGGLLDMTGKTYAIASLGLGNVAGNRLVLTGQTALPEYAVTCGDFDDVVLGPDSASLLLGLKGNDVLRGGMAGDEISGGLGEDRIDGGGGGDVIEGGGGKDRLIGGNGADAFTYGLLTESRPGTLRSDVITDFESGTDLIDLAVLGQKGTVLFVQDVLGDPFSGVAGEIRISYNISGTRTVVALDADGDAAADFAICLNGIHALSSTDFIL
ncbi:M10 family metallopeptidase C-terminal domain-containing protein [Aestuariivirga sp.]|uniref:M10 family metallopeptidase C-terminal domain-containing protein n=1 Tax=Aestuariivirga sp. TaxID=2650926 RepID=UPI0035940B30